MKLNKFTVKCIKSSLRSFKEFKNNSFRNNLKCDNTVLKEGIRTQNKGIKIKMRNKAH